MFSKTEENYLKALYHLETTDNGVSTSDLSGYLKVKAGSVTDMLKKLADRGLVQYEKYYGASLSDEGRTCAVTVVRKHRLWETFLVNHLNFEWDEVHEVAEQLEHIQSKKLVEELDVFLKRPKYDPHGDPIPDKEGKLPKMSRIKLQEAAIGSEGICSGFDDSSSSFLQFLAKQNIGLGTQIKVEAIEPYDGSVSVRLNSKTIVLSKQATENIYINLVH